MPGSPACSRWRCSPCSRHSSFAAAKDRNHDRIPDRWEKQHNLSLKVDQARRDQDRDSLVNLKEFRAGMDPRDDDSDDDGIEDSDEGAGTVASFDAATGELTIDMFGQGTATGQVTDVTEISCDGGDDSVDDNGGNDPSGTEPGHGGQGGDDPTGTEDDPGHGGHGGDDPALRFRRRHRHSVHGRRPPARRPGPRGRARARERHRDLAQVELLK